MTNDEYRTAGMPRWPASFVPYSSFVTRHSSFPNFLQRPQFRLDPLELGDRGLDVGVAQGAPTVDDEDGALVRRRAAVDGDAVVLHRPVPEVAQQCDLAGGLALLGELHQRR